VSDNPEPSSGVRAFYGPSRPISESSISLSGNK
jgi:hypothetical protein